ncbi:outer mitochondrial membrane transport complex protein-domain-containing protein [Crassisporium funariophilum]|nr:outer mitochondrial membrane transport complex protein-domain-containing protein [Crassisporium funariophilum]
MNSNLPSSGIVLHIWPGQWGLPSFDPQCLAAVLYLQLAIPGKFRVIECSNPDYSPTGQLPFLLHDQHVVASYTSIIKYVSGLQSSENTTYPNADLDSHLTISNKAKRTAWCAHAESHLGDLVYHSLYSMNENWTNLTHTALAALFPVPQKYYVPRRIRDAYIPRLEAAGLWNLPIEDTPADKPFKKEGAPAPKEGLKKNATLSQAFEREKVTAKARTELDLYEQLLSNKQYVFSDQPSSLDIIITAHILLLLNPPYPDPQLKNLVNDSYPALASSSRRIFSQVFEDGKSTIEFAPPTSGSFWALLPSWPKHHQVKKPKSPEDLHYDRMRWGFFGLALGTIGAYIAIVGSQYELVWPGEEHHHGEET